MFPSIATRALICALLLTSLMPGCAPDSSPQEAAPASQTEPLELTQTETLRNPCRKITYAYPVTIAPYSDKERACVAEIIKDIVAAHPESWLVQSCYTINNWGEFGGSYSNCPWFNPATTFTEADVAPALQKVIAALHLLSPLLPTADITDQTQPIVDMSPAECWATCRAYKSIVFRFEVQTIEGREVVNSKLSVVVVPGKIVDIFTNWRTDVSMPQNPAVPEVQGRNALIGTELTYSDFAGNPISGRISAESLGSGRLVVYRIDRDGNGVPQDPMYQLAWEYPVDGHSWLAYVDAMTGEVIAIHQMFMT